MVSGDFNHNPNSSVIDLSEIKVLQKDSVEPYHGMTMNGVFQIDY